MTSPPPHGRRLRGFWRDLGDRVEMAGVRLAIAVGAPFGTDRFRRIAAACGRAAGPLIPPLRRRVAANLALVRPGAGRDEVRALSAEVGAQFFATMAEYIRMDDIAADPSRLRVEGAEHLAAPLAEGRGIVLATAHFGQWEAIRLAMRAQGRDCALIYRAFNNPRFDRLAMKLIRHAGEPVFHKGREGTRGLLRHVARGGAALILIDQRQTGAPLIPFLGVEAETATAAAELALRFRGALIPACGRRAEDGRFEVRFAPAVAPAEPVAMMAEANARLSQWIEADPGQWFWLHRRWRLRRERGDRIRAARGDGG